MNREHLESMRWLYDSDESYRKAMRAILAEEVKEKRRALLKKKLRQARFKKKVYTLKQSLRRLIPTRLQARRLGSRLRVRRLRRLLKKLTASRKRMAIAGAGVLGAMVVAVLVLGVIASKRSPSNGAGGKDGQVAGAQTPADAPFQPVIVSDKAVTTDDYRYDAQKQVLSYATTVAGVKATISQQPFPEAFIQDSAKFDEFLESIKNKQTIPLTNGTAYISVDKETDQAQFGVYMTPKYLVFIRSDQPIEPASWQDYFKNFTVNELPK